MRTDPPCAARDAVVPPWPAGWADPAWLKAGFAAVDRLHHARAAALAALGIGGAREHAVVASGRLWRLREYGGGGGGAGPPLLIVQAPIKSPVVWDLAPASVVGRCLDAGLRVFLLEWLPASAETVAAGLAAYAARSLADAVAAVSGRAGGARPCLAGHSLGGTFAVIRAALDGDAVSGLVLLGTPLCFAPGSGRFRDAVAGLQGGLPASLDIVPGSLLSGLCASISSDVFVWPRVMDAWLSLGDPAALAVQAGVERWSLEELPLPGRLVREVFEWLYRGDRLCRGVLEIEGRRICPAALRVPTLAVAGAADEVAPPASVRPFVEAIPGGRGSLLECDRETGVGLQHLAVLVGRRAHARTWPRIVDWLRRLG